MWLFKNSISATPLRIRGNHQIPVKIVLLNLKILALVQECFVNMQIMERKLNNQSQHLNSHCRTEGEYSMFSVVNVLFHCLIKTACKTGIYWKFPNKDARRKGTLSLESSSSGFLQNEKRTIFGWDMAKNVQNISSFGVKRWGVAPLLENLR